jgi:hypothetical protein
MTKYKKLREARKKLKDEIARELIRHSFWLSIALGMAGLDDKKNRRLNPLYDQLLQLGYWYKDRITVHGKRMTVIRPNRAGKKLFLASFASRDDSRTMREIAGDWGYPISTKLGPADKTTKSNGKTKGS